MVTLDSREKEAGPAQEPTITSQSVANHPTATPANQMPEGRINYDYPFPTLHLKHCSEITTGRLVNFLNNWRVITQDNWVLQTISGYKIPFISNPRQWRPNITRVRTPKQTHLMEEVIQSLLQKKAVKEV